MNQSSISGYAVSGRAIAASNYLGLIPELSRAISGLAISGRAASGYGAKKSKFVRLTALALTTPAIDTGAIQAPLIASATIEVMD